MVTKKEWILILLSIVSGGRDAAITIDKLPSRDACHALAAELLEDPDDHSEDFRFHKYRCVEVERLTE